MPCSPVPKTSSFTLLTEKDFLIVDMSLVGDSGGESVFLGEEAVAAALWLMGGSLICFTVVSPRSPKYLTGETERLEVGWGSWHIQDCIQREEMRLMREGDVGRCQDVVDVSSKLSLLSDESFARPILIKHNAPSFPCPCVRF